MLQQDHLRWRFDNLSKYAEQQSEWHRRLDGLLQQRLCAAALSLHIETKELIAKLLDGGYWRGRQG